MSATSASRPPSSARFRLSRITPVMWSDVAVISALSVLAAIGFEPAFGHAGFIIASLSGLLIGTVIALGGYLLRFSMLTTIAIAITLYFVFGTVATMPHKALLGFLPSFDGLSGLVVGAVFGWSDALTLQAPIEAPPYIAVVPYVSTWLVSLVVISLATRWLPRKQRTPLRSSVLLGGPILLFLAGILLGTHDAFFAGVRGVVFAGVALAWLGWRRSRIAGLNPRMDSGLLRRKIVGTGIVVVVAVVVGAVAGAALAPPANSRYVLRQEMTPPFDPLNYPSPLAGFRKYTKDMRTTDLFDVSGMRDGDLIRLASMDSYNGIVWSVTGPQTQTNGSGSFELLGRTIPRPPMLRAGATSTVKVSVTGYSDVWLPNLGYMTGLNFTNFTGTDPETTIRVNTTTGTAAVTSGVNSGLSYTLQITAPKPINDKQLAHVPPATIEMPPVTNIPDIVGAKAEEYAGSATSAIQKLRNIERSLKKLGYLSHGRASEPVPSRAGEGADRMTDLFAKQPMVGDEEQYASAFALMARHLGYPTRVVMGFKPKVHGSTTTVTGDDVTAWAEVAFDGIRWVPFFPTPTKTDAPQDQTTKPKFEPQPQVRQPPQTNPKSEELLTPVKTKDEPPEKKKDQFEVPGWAYIVGGVLGIPLLLYFVPFLIIAALKRRRRRKRMERSAGDFRAAGAWEQLTDSYSELGFELEEKSTRPQAATQLEVQALEQELPVVPYSIFNLAVRVDEAIFAGRNAADGEVDALWQETEASVAEVSADAGWLRRQVASFKYRRVQRDRERHIKMIIRQRARQAESNL